MGEILVETPQGEVIVEIAGSEPTPEEQQKIRAAFSGGPKQLATGSFDDLLAKAKAANVSEGFDYETGADAGLRAMMSFGDIAEEREGILLKAVGEAGYTRDNQGRLALTPEGQRIRGMSPSDKNIVIEDEGFTLGDLADLAGILPETIGAITGSILTAPSIIATAGGAAAGAAAGQALEESIETALGIQKQSLPEVLADVGQEAALAGVVDFVTLGTFRAGKAIVGGGAKRLSAAGEPVDSAMGRELVDRDYRPSLERLGAPTILAKGAKFVKGATGDVSDIINNTTKALEEKQAFLDAYKAISAEEGGDAFIRTTNKKMAELSAKEAAASRSALKAVQDSIDFIGRSVDEGTDINNETLNAVTSAFKNFQEVAVSEFRIMDDMISRLEAGAISDAVSVGGKTRIVPVAGIKAAADDLIETTGSKQVLPGPVQIALKGIEDLNKSGRASFEQIATQRKLINDALFEANLGPAATEQLFKLRDAFDNSLSADYLTANIKGLKAPQRKLLKQIEDQRKKARNTYSMGMDRFDDLRKFGIIRDIRQATKDGRFDSDNFFAKIVRRDQPERLKSVLSAVDNSELVRSQLAKSFVDDAMQRTSVDLLNPDQFNGALFRNRITNLGDSTGKVLFGSDWPQVKKLADTVAQIGTKNISRDAVDNIVRLDADKGIIESMNDLISVKNEIGRMGQIKAVDKLNKGNLTPEEAVGDLINYKTKPADWKKIEELFANDQTALQDVRRSMIEKILGAVDEDIFTSPKAAAKLKTEIGRYDQSVMKQVLGEPVYDNINKFADEMIYLGDVGKEGSIAQGAITAQLSQNPIQAVTRDLRMRGMAKFFSNPALINYYAGKGTSSSMANVQGVFNGIGNVLEASATAMTAGRQFGIRAFNEQYNRAMDRLNAAANQPLEPVAPPSTASGIGQVDVFGSTLPIGARGSTNAGRGNLRQMATNNPEVARALGIRGATAGLLG